MDLKGVCEQIKEIRTYLIKIGPKRRKGQILKTKLDEAKQLLAKYNSYVSELQILIQSGKLLKEEIKEVNRQCDIFKLQYNDILNFCSETNEFTEEVEKMEDFNLKTALSLLPIMTDEEQNTKQLIDSIEYYGSLLEKSECKVNLINFVLKNRLSQSAKLKLNSSYTTIKDLVEDMQKQLLPRKSATAIQCRLQSIKQNEKNIADFGKEITELFVDLTISQADGKSESYKVLKPLNEKFAIKKFADGLRNRRLSTIIAARDFTDLKDAIQAAQDEEVASAGPSSELMTMYRGNYHRSSRGRSFTNGRGHCGNNFNTRGQSVNYRPTRYFRSQQFSNRRGGRMPSHAGRRGNRGRKIFHTQSSPKNVNTMVGGYMGSGYTSEEEEEKSLAHFFRA